MRENRSLTFDAAPSSVGRVARRHRRVACATSRLTRTRFRSDVNTDESNPSVNPALQRWCGRGPTALRPGREPFRVAATEERGDVSATQPIMRSVIFPPHFFHRGKKRTPHRPVDSGFGASRATRIWPARTRNIARTAVNWPTFAVAQHKASFPHEWHSFSSLNCCCGLLDRLASGWLWLEPLINGVSE